MVSYAIMTFPLPLQIGHYRVRDEGPKEVEVMKRGRFSEEQIIGILKEAEAGLKVADLCRKQGISDVTFSTAWKRSGESLRLGDRVTIRSGHTVPWVD